MDLVDKLSDPNQRTCSTTTPTPTDAPTAASAQYNNNNNDNNHMMLDYQRTSANSFSSPTSMSVTAASADTMDTQQQQQHHQPHGGGGPSEPPTVHMATSPQHAAVATAPTQQPQTAAVGAATASIPGTTTAPYDPMASATTYAAAAAAAASAASASPFGAATTTTNPTNGIHHHHTANKDTISSSAATTAFTTNGNSNGIFSSSNTATLNGCSSTTPAAAAGTTSSPSSSSANNNTTMLPPPTRESVLQRLSEALLRRSLAKIDLSQKGLSPQDARLVKMALLQNRQLRVLKLGYNQLGDEGIQTLVAGISQHSQLQSLDLGFNHIGDAGCQALAQALTSPTSSLTTLYLAGNCIGQEGAMALADVVRRGGCTTLQKLYMTGNRLGPEGVKALTEAILEAAAASRRDNTGPTTPPPSQQPQPPPPPPPLQQHSGGLEELFLGGTDLGKAGCQAIARLLGSPDCRLKVLSLANCEIGDYEIIRQDGWGLAPCIKGNRDHMVLRSFQLSFNSITHKGLEALMNALWGSRTLKELRIDNNDIGDRGAQQLAAILPYLKTLETLDVGFNNINNKNHGMKILMKAVAETNNLKSLSLSGNPMQDVSSAKAVAYALAYNVSLESLLLVHCHLTTEGQRHVAAGAVSNSRTSLREVSGFPIGPVIVTLGFPDALEHWTNDQVLNFIHLMWNKTKSENGGKSEDDEKGLDPLNFLPRTDSNSTNGSSNNNKAGLHHRRSGPLEATIVVDVARKAFASLVANGVDVFSRRPGHSKSPAVLAPRDAIMLESVDGDSIIESMGEVAVSSSSSPSSSTNILASSPPRPPSTVTSANGSSGSDTGSSMSSAKKQARSFVAPPQERSAAKQNQLPDPSRKKRIVEWLCSNIKHLNKMSQVPFDSSELLRLHQHYFTPVVNESGGSSGFKKDSNNGAATSPASSRQASSVPNVHHGSANSTHMEDASVSSSTMMQSSDVNMVPASDPMFQQQHPQQRPHQQRSGHQAVASSLPMLKRKVSYRFLGDAAMHQQQSPPSLMGQQQAHSSSPWGNAFGGGGSHVGSVAKMIQEGPSGHSLPPKNKKARRNRTRISFLPRVKAKLDSYLDVCHEKALITMRQLYYVEQAILTGRVNPLEADTPRTHLSGALATDAETIVVDMM